MIGAMRRSIERLGALAVAVAMAAASCDPEGPAAPEAGADAGLIDSGADVDVEAEASEDADDTADAQAAPGPLTFVVDERGVTAERLRGVDGNGSLDNVIADLGSPAAALMAATLTAAFQRTITTKDARTIVHFPWVDDTGPPGDPDTAVTVFGGLDLDDPEDPDADFSGEEPFHVDSEELDGCGEPRSFALGASIRRGALEAHLSYVLVDGIAMQGDGQLLGTIEPGGASAAFALCGYATARNLGEVEMDDLTWLEVFCAGGAAFGLPGLPGVTLDVDVDGDGLERFVVHAAGHIARCIDGDGHTTIDGPDCWQDGRMADGFSLVVVLHAVSARFAGRQPG